MRINPPLNLPNKLEYLGDKHFAAVLFAALLFHLLIGYGWFIMPRSKVLDIPVHMLNVRLGDEDLQEQEEAIKPQPISDDTLQPEEEIRHIRQSIPKQTPRPTPPKIDKKPVEPRQFVREDVPDALPKPDTLPKNEGLALGNSTASNAEIVANYAKNTSLWIAKFKLQYEGTGEKGLKGTPLVRIRIDRRGNIRSSFIDTSSGHEDLDRAALDMVRRSNPVPAVPNDYPQGEMFEFLIPVTIELH
jgi:protein TonB